MNGRSEDFCSVQVMGLAGAIYRILWEGDQQLNAYLSSAETIRLRYFLRHSML